MLLRTPLSRALFRLAPDRVLFRSDVPIVVEADIVESLHA